MKDVLAWDPGSYYPIERMRAQAWKQQGCAIEGGWLWLDWTAMEKASIFKEMMAL